ncbi:MAG: YbaK/EbsC family protein [Chloroflexi bacterium]|nr:YbaK/EbsC family protein [Chloroflexota bacterium]MCL5273132.1 YbaK/EbsC family protein [Chloroflexota bacterium]
MEGNLSPSAQRVQDALKSAGFENKVIELPQTTRSAAEAAQAISCTVAQIAKSLVFRTGTSRRALLVIASGANRVNEKRFAALIGEAIERPDADFVRQQTGFAIGGVPPIGHAVPLETYIDEDLQQYMDIWAAAGTPVAIFHLTPDQLISMTGGRVINVK